MKLTRSVSYGLGILLRVLQLNHSEPVTAAAIAEGCDFPPRFLYRVLRRMVDAGLLTGVSGPGGGYSLARSAKEITLLDVVYAVEGPLEPSVLEPVNRKQKKVIDSVNRLCSRNAADFEQDLKKITLAKLVR